MKTKRGLVRRALSALGLRRNADVRAMEQRIRHLENTRNFTAAAVNRITGGWSANGVTIDSVLSGELPALRARARDLRKNNEYFQKFLSMLASNVVGESGMTLKNKASDPHTFADGELIKGKPDKMANDLIEEAFWEWGKKENCTTAKNLTWVQVQHLNVTELGTCGETLWRMVRGPEAGNRFNFALEPIAIDRLDHCANHNLSNGNRVRMGVETNRSGRVVAYWITDADPTDTVLPRPGQFTTRRYDARDFLHPFLMREIGQTRGYPWAAAAMLRLKMLADYDQAEITGSVAASRKMAFLTSGLGPNAAPAQYAGEGDGSAAPGKYMDAEDACIEQLPYGMDIKALDWNHPNSIYGDFTGACLRGIACGLSVSYPNLANDYASVNFSSGRMARQEEIETWKFLQSTVASDFNCPVFSAWLEMALLSGACNYTLASGKELVLPASKFAKFNQPRFYGRRWQWLDPTKEVAAIAEQLRLKLTTRTRVAAELGEEWLEIIDELELEREEAAKRGITLPEDVEEQAALAPVTEAPEPDEDDAEDDAQPATA